MRLYLLVMLLLMTLPLSAQIFGPVARPVAPGKEKRNLRKGVVLETTGGVNLSIGRSLQTKLIKVDGFNSRPGLQLGLNAVFRPKAKTNIVLGVGFVWDRGRLIGYRKSAKFNIDPTRSMDPIIFRERVGDVRIDEKWLRGSVGLRFGIGALKALIGFQISDLISGSQRYDFTQTTMAFLDPITGRVVLLEEPLISQGSWGIIGKHTTGGYSGTILGLSYPVTERLKIAVDLELGWHFNSIGRKGEWRHRRSRLGLGVVYQLVGFSRD